MELLVPGQALRLKHGLPALLSFMGSESCCHQVLGAPVGPGPRAAHRAGLCSARVWLSPLLCQECQAGGSKQQAAQEGTRHGIRRDQLDQEPSWGCKEEGGGLGAGEKVIAPWPHPSCGSQPGKTPCPRAGQCTQQQPGDGGDQGSHWGRFALTFTPRGSRSGNPGTACPTLCKHPAMPGGRDSDTGSWPWRRHSPMPCSGTTRHVMALHQGRCRGAAAADGCSRPWLSPKCPPALPSVQSLQGWGARQHPLEPKPSPKSN